VDNSSERYKTDFPVGHTIVFRDGQYRDNNSAVSSNFINILHYEYSFDENVISYTPSGTWRTRGYIKVDVGGINPYITILQRTA
jgi:hypothetical protein